MAGENDAAGDGVGDRSEEEHLLGEAERIAVAIGQMFPGLCEVVLHDLRHPEHAIRTIENNLSGRRVGDPATELGLARIADPRYPSVLQNYANKFEDGRHVKSTSIGIRNSSGQFIAALCLNLDLSTLGPLAILLTGLATISPDAGDARETLSPRTTRELREVIDHFAASRAMSPRALSRASKRELIQQLHRDGFFEPRGSAQTIADALGISRATVYNYIRSG